MACRRSRFIGAAGFTNESESDRIPYTAMLIDSLRLPIKFVTIQYAVLNKVLTHKYRFDKLHLEKSKFLSLLIRVVSPELEDKVGKMYNKAWNWVHKSIKNNDFA